MLADDGFEDNYTIVTEKHTFTAPFVNAEETQYLCIEDHYTNGRPPLELGGVLYCDRETVDKIEKMKVCTCLNPLHTAMSIYGCMLGYTLISAEMADEDLRCLYPEDRLYRGYACCGRSRRAEPLRVHRRCHQPPSAQPLHARCSPAYRYRYLSEAGYPLRRDHQGLRGSAVWISPTLMLIPLVLAGYARYLKGIDDNGQPFEIFSPIRCWLSCRPSSAPLEVKEGEQDFSCLKALYSRADVFGVDLYAVGLGEKIEGMVKELYAGNGAVRKTLHKYTLAR